MIGSFFGPGGRDTCTIELRLRHHMSKARANVPSKIVRQENIMGREDASGCDPQASHRG
jgi:hypothetical protein